MNTSLSVKLKGGSKLQFVLLTLISWVSSLTPIPCSVHAEEPRDLCPRLPDIMEVDTQGEKAALACSDHIKDSSGLHQHRGDLRLKHQWIIDRQLIALSKQGGRGWRWYRPLQTNPSYLPWISRPKEACAHRVDLFSKEGQVWALERWSFRAPRHKEERSISLSHPSYEVRALNIVINKEVAQDKQWILLPSRGCPSLLKASTPESGLLACGMGIRSKRPPTLEWQRRDVIETLKRE